MRGKEEMTLMESRHEEPQENEDDPASLVLRWTSLRFADEKQGTEGIDPFLSCFFCRMWFNFLLNFISDKKSCDLILQE